MRLIADGVVDRDGVEGLSRKVGYTPRHLTRLLTAELGAGPLALARARRAQTARVLIETTELGVRRRRVRVRLRERAAVQRHRARGVRRQPDRAARPPWPRAQRPASVTMRLAVRTPFAGQALLDFLAFHLVPGVEVAGTAGTPAPSTCRTVPARSDSRSPTLRSPGQTAFVTARFALHDLRDIAAAVERARRLVDADCDPIAVDDAFAGDPVDRPAGAGDSRAAGARSGRRRRDRDPHGHRPAGQRRRRVHGRRAGSSPRTARPSRPTSPA